MTVTGSRYISCDQLEPHAAGPSIDPIRAASMGPLCQHGGLWHRVGESFYLLGVCVCVCVHASLVTDLLSKETTCNKKTVTIVGHDLHFQWPCAHSHSPYCSIPEVTTPTPQAVMPIPQVTMPTPQVRFPTPQVMVPTPQVMVLTPIGAPTNHLSSSFLVTFFPLSP